MNETDPVLTDGWPERGWTQARRGWRVLLAVVSLAGLLLPACAPALRPGAALPGDLSGLGEANSAPRRPLILIPGLQVLSKM